MDDTFNFENYNGIFGILPIKEKFYNHYVNSETVENRYTKNAPEKARCLILRKETDVHGKWKS